MKQINSQKSIVNSDIAIVNANKVIINGDIYVKEDYVSSKWLHVPELKMYVEIEVHDKGKSWDDLGLNYGDEKLLKIDEVVFLANSKYAKTLKMDGSSSNNDFYFDQPLELNKKKKHVAWFYAYSGYAGLCFYEYSRYSYSFRGVRFCRRYK